MAKKEKAKQKGKKKKEPKYNKIPSSNNAQDLQLQLARIGLVEKDILGDGNCLFRSLADQFYGDPQRYKEMREKICKHIVDFDELYKDFITDDESFDHYVQRMSNDRTHGGNMELVAASRYLDRVIYVHQVGQAIWKIGEVEKEDKPPLHIIYHSWEHYSSVRNKDGPHSGFPNIHLQECHVPDNPTRIPSELTDFEKIVIQSANLEMQDLPLVRKLLEKHRGNPSAVVDEILEDQDFRKVSDSTVDDWIPEHIKNNLSKQKSRKQKIQENREKRKKRGSRDQKQDAIETINSMISAISI